MRVYRFADLEIRPAERSVLIAGRPVPLGLRAFDTLAVLLRHPDRSVGIDELMATVWPGLVVEENNVRQQVRALRKMLGPNVIRTVAGRGYQMGLEQTPALSATPPDTPRPPAESGKPMVAIFPLINLSAEPGQDYLASGITQDIITHLSRYRWLSVLSRNITMHLDPRQDMRMLATELQARYAVTGTVRRQDRSVRVTAELSETANGRQIWSGRYDETLDDLFALQDRITQGIAAQLEPQIGLAERQKITRLPTADPDAWGCYHLGMGHFFRFTAQDNQQALKLFQQSRELDPGFGEAHAWWAYAAVLDMIYWQSAPSPLLLDAALAAVEQALDLDDENAVFYMIKARVQLARGEYESAMMGNEIAINLNPTLAAAYCSLGDTLAYLDRHDEAIGCFEKSLMLSPRDPQRWAFLTYGALALIFKRDFETALAWSTTATEIPNHQYWTLAHRAVALAHLGRTAQARDCAARLLRIQPAFNQAFAQRKLFYLRQESQLRLYLEGLALAGVD